MSLHLYGLFVISYLLRGKFSLLKIVYVGHILWILIPCGICIILGFPYWRGGMEGLPSTFFSLPPLDQSFIPESPSPSPNNNFHVANK